MAYLAKTQRLLDNNRITIYHVAEKLKINKQCLSLAIQKGEYTDYTICFLLTLLLADDLIKRRECPQCQKNSLYLVHNQLVGCKHCDYIIQLKKLKT